MVEVKLPPFFLNLSLATHRMGHLDSDIAINSKNPELCKKLELLQGGYADLIRRSEAGFIIQEGEFFALEKSFDELHSEAQAGNLLKQDSIIK